MKLPHIISYITLALTFLLLITLGFWEYYPYKVFEYVGDKSLVINKDKIVKAGEVLTIQTNLEHFSEGLTANVSPQLIDGSIINYPSVSFVTRKGHQIFERSFEIPAYLPSGTYHMEIQMSIKVNPIREINFIRSSEDFIITSCELHCKK